MGRRATPVTVSKRQREILEGWVRASKTPQDLGVRTRIVLMSAKKVPTWKQMLELKTDPQRISRWRVRWARCQERLTTAEDEGASDKELEVLVLSALSDAPRSGAPPKFTPEQVTALIALACEKPQDSGLPVSHWTPADLTREAIKRGIVDSISPRQVDRFLKRSRAQTTQKPLLADIAGQAGRPRALPSRGRSALRHLLAGSAAGKSGDPRR